MLQKQDDKNEDLTRRINADLKAKLQGRSKMDDPDFMETSEFSDDLFKNIRV